MYQVYHKEHFSISTDPSKLDVDAIHTFLTNSYWAEGIPRAVVARSIQHSLCFGVYDGDQQIGFARVISDYATFAYIGDVYILESHRGRGLAKWLMACIMAHPDLQGLRRMSRVAPDGRGVRTHATRDASLATRDAHGLYRQFGFNLVRQPERWMELSDPNIYKK